MPDERQQRPEEWFGLGDDHADQRPASEDDSPTAFLRRIMADPRTSDTARVAAAKALMDRGVEGSDDNLTAADLTMLRDVRAMSSAELDKELAAFMVTGNEPPPDGTEAYFSKLEELHYGERHAGDKPLPARWEREVRRRVARRVRRVAEQVEERVAAISKQMQQSPEEAVASPSASGQCSAAVVVPLRAAQRGQRTPTQQAMVDADRAALPPGVRQHVPPGLDPRDVLWAWSSGRV